MNGALEHFSKRKLAQKTQNHRGGTDKTVLQSQLVDKFKSGLCGAQFRRWRYALGGKSRQKKTKEGEKGKKREWGIRNEPRLETTEQTR